ncbi:ATP-dependent helicase, partial [Patescibacteria group bacterium]|nr:ATP-dependent helicase [Patescibacteria group bacterium]
MRQREKRLMVDQKIRLKLDLQQRQAVAHGKGPLLIIAGAGTGKTTVVTRRIENLIVNKKVKPDQVLALTFTEKAAHEMEERVDRLLPYGYTDMWISTFHSFCDRVLRRDGVEVGLNPAYRLMAQAEAIDFFRHNLFSFKLEHYRPLGNPNKFVGGLLTHFSRLRDEDVTPDQYLDWVKENGPLLGKEERKKYLELATVYQKYAQLKIRYDVLDFADLISWTLRLLRERKSVLRRYRKQFEYLLVDEFQDTNRAQNELAVLLAGKEANLAVCGDDDQSIYRFRGAAEANIRFFCQRYPEAKKVVLKSNYRSGQRILNRAYRLIQFNNPDRLEIEQGVNKHLLAQRKSEPGRVHFLLTNRVEEEAQMVVEEILGAKKRGYAWGEMAILVRANNHAEPFVRALSRQRIPYQFLGPGKLLKQEEVKDLMAYLHLLDNFENDVACYRLLATKVVGISPRDLAALVNAARKQNLSLFEAVEKAGEVRISPETKERLGWFVQMVYRHLGSARKETAGQILYYFMQDSGLLKEMTDYTTVEGEIKAQNVAKFFDRLKKYETDHLDSSVAAVTAWLSLAVELGESPLAGSEDWTEEDRVNLLTIHSSKGLEFRVVFLVDLVGSRFPSRNRSELIPLPQGVVKESPTEGD